VARRETLRPGSLYGWAISVRARGSNRRRVSACRERTGLHIRVGPPKRPVAVGAHVTPADADQEGALPFRWPDFSREREIRLTEALSEEILAVYEEKTGRRTRTSLT
jgi:hypothetical protein